MKTFRELISWELEQDAKEKRLPLSLSEDDAAGKLSASVLRQLRYINAAGGSSEKASHEGFSPA